MNLLRIFFKKLIFFLLLILALASTFAIMAGRCGCGARVLQGKIRSSGGRYQARSGRAEEGILPSIVAPPFFAMYAVNRWRRFKIYLWPEQYAQCTCPIEDHEWTWSDRVLIVILVLICVVLINMLFGLSGAYRLWTLGLSILFTFFCFVRDIKSSNN